MIVNHSLKYLYIHNPKTAGTFLRRLFKHENDTKLFWGNNRLGFKPGRKYYKKKRGDFAHLLPYQYSLFNDLVRARAENYDKIIIIRNPYQRFKSAYNHYRKYCKWFLDRNRYFLSLDSQSFTLNNCIDALKVNDIATHFVPQSNFIKGLENILVLKYEDEALLHKLHEATSNDKLLNAEWNPKESGFSDLLVDPEHISFINDFYHDDFVLGQYEKLSG